MSRRLEVLLHGQVIGQLAETRDDRSEFRFLDAYHNLVPRPVLGQKFEDDLERAHRSRRSLGLPDFFANLIPEGRLREVIEETSNLERGDDFALLAFVGSDLPGAVIVREATEKGQGVLSDESATEFSRSEETGEPPGPPDLRFSLAGVQLKFSMLLQEDRLTLPARGTTGEWIVKFDSPRFPRLPENEHSMLEWARAAGFEVPESRLFGLRSLTGFPRQYAPPDSHVLAIRRYDRSSEGRVHQEDFAQAIGLPPRRKYDQVTYEAMAHLVRRFIDDRAIDEFIRRLVFAIAAGNSDAHLKNWSLIYPDRIRARWSPLYDQVATIAWPEPGRSLSLKLAGVKSFRRIDRSCFERFAERAHLDVNQTLALVDETLDGLRRSWQEVLPALPLPKAHVSELREHWRKVPLLREAGPIH